LFFLSVRSYFLGQGQESWKYDCNLWLSISDHRDLFLQSSVYNDKTMCIFYKCNKLNALKIFKKMQGHIWKRFMTEIEERPQCKIYWLLYSFIFNIFHWWLWFLQFKIPSGKERHKFCKIMQLINILGRAQKIVQLWHEKNAFTS